MYPINSLGVAPCEMLMSRLLRTKLPVVEQKLNPKVQNVFNRQVKAQERYKNEYDKKERWMESWNISQQRYNS